MKTVSVFFEDCKKKYDFNCDEELNVTEWDVVVVDTVNGLQTAVVTDVCELDEEEPFPPTKWVVDKVNPRKIQRAKINAKIKKLEDGINQLKGTMKIFDEESLKNKLSSDCYFKYLSNENEYGRE